jgi:hypothetical protein
MALCRAQHQAGDFSGELKCAKEAHADFPSILAFSIEEAAALSALGRVAEVQKMLHSMSGQNAKSGTGSRIGVRLHMVLELRAHGHPGASRAPAEELIAEIRSLPPELRTHWRPGEIMLLEFVNRPQEALDLAISEDRVVTTFRDKARSLGIHGCLLARLGRKDEARQIELDLAELTCLHPLGLTLYHRATIAAQLGELDRAVMLMRQAYGQGFPFSWLHWNGHVHQDINLEPLRGYPPYEELMKPKD